jgi:hypothetical protein
MLVCDLIASLIVFIDHLVLSHASLSAALSDMAQWCYDLEEKCLRNQADLTQRCSVSHPDLRDKAECISYMRQRRQHI